MQKPMQIVLIALIVVLAIVAAVLFANNQKTTSQLAQSKAAVEQADARYARTIDAITEIQDSLNAIALPDTAGAAPWTVRAGQEPTDQQGREALQRISLMRSSITRSKERIRQLESDLKKSGIKVAGLQKMIEGLKESVAAKEAQVAALSARVDTLQTQVAGLETTVQETQDTLRVREQTLEERRRELATIFYAIGTKSQLTKAGVIVEKGGVLGLGQTLVVVPGAPDSAFTRLDTDYDKDLRTYAVKARVLSAQPASSYELRPVDGKLELHILDPTEFRKIRRLVILTS